MNSAENITGHPYETGAGLINVSRAISSGMHAEINGKPSWEDSVPKGMTATATLSIQNTREHAVNVSLTASLPSDNNGQTLDPSTLSFPAEAGLGPMEEKTIKITFSGENAPYGTYAAILDIVSADDRVRIPVSITVSLRGDGIITGSVDDDCSEKTQEGCGMNPTGYIGQWGDWRFYKLENSNGSILRVNLSWEGTDTDLDLYLFGPDGGLYGLSGDANTESEYITLTDPVYSEYWAAVYAYDIAPAAIGYDLHVSYASTVRVEPASWQGTAARGEELLLNYTLINDGSSDADLEIETVTRKSMANKTVTGNIRNTGTDHYDFIWKKSTSGLNLAGTQYMNATLTWNNPSKDLDLYFFYKSGSAWNASKYMSIRASDLLGIGREEILNADIKYYLEAFSDVGFGVTNPGSTQSYALTLNFSGEGTCDYATTNPPAISSLASNEERAIQVSVDTDLLTAGNTYDIELLVSGNGEDKTRVPIRIYVTDPTTGPPCSLAGDYPPCGEVTLAEVIDMINRWVENEEALNDVAALINAWATT
jgi:hypothetical protein